MVSVTPSYKVLDKVFVVIQVILELLLEECSRVKAEPKVKRVDRKGDSTVLLGVPVLLVTTSDKQAVCQASIPCNEVLIHLHH